MTVSSSVSTSPLKLAVITGLSGAGRSTAAKCLEDLSTADVARVDDALDARERTDRFGTKQSVRIRDEPDCGHCGARANARIGP